MNYPCSTGRKAPGRDLFFSPVPISFCKLHGEGPPLPITRHRNTDTIQIHGFGCALDNMSTGVTEKKILCILCFSG